ncbi:A24 family peptidase [Oscillatoria sp. FACHB-1406]|uniref:prepilin peptidase n=1 Tax=Oscillatoria sp. FACHB-1406 TaxID=2692846 RepID=UPI001681E57C|nr:A24 family peptidase [Oscillatoria sp. FACHB-1406]MBD2580421.1 prepilin peptidase [Oscillatoria sp. FACHB-1406]
MVETFLWSVTTVLVFALGASIGSFINVVVYRLPAGLSILYPPSRCPHCLHRLGKGENVPILGWMWLRGKCLQCKAPISVRYPLVEAIAGFLYVATFWYFGYSWQTLSYWAFLSWLLALSFIDLDTLTLPNPLTQSGLVVGTIFAALVGVLGTPLQPLTASLVAQQLMGGILGTVVGIWLFDSISLLGSLIFRKTAMGAGDAKLAAMMGAWLGWKYLLVAGFLACLLGALVGGGAIALSLLSRKKAIPFGPFLALGAILTVFWGEKILSSYLQLFFPLSMQ